MEMVYFSYFFYQGGPGQYAHLAPTYAAINALCVLNTKVAYDSINRCVYVYINIYNNNITIIDYLGKVVLLQLCILYYFHTGYCLSYEQL